MEGIYSYAGTVAGLALRLANERTGAAYQLSLAGHQLGVLAGEYTQPSEKDWSLLEPVYDDR